MAKIEITELEEFTAIAAELRQLVRELAATVRPAKAWVTMKEYAIRFGVPYGTLVNRPWLWPERHDDGPTTHHVFRGEDAERYCHMTVEEMKAEYKKRRENENSLLRVINEQL